MDKHIDCGKEYEKGFNQELLERFSNTYEFCGNDLNKFLIRSWLSRNRG